MQTLDLDTRHLSDEVPAAIFLHLERCLEEVAAYKHPAWAIIASRDLEEQ
jgi:hypothetical protein